jgi:hypothetical protein
MTLDRDKQLREEIDHILGNCPGLCKKDDCWFKCHVRLIDKGEMDKAQVDAIMQAVQAHQKDDFIHRFREQLEDLSVTDFAHVLSVVIYMKAMENTNAETVTFTLEGFNNNGEILGDMVIKAELTNKDGARNKTDIHKGEL